MPQEDEVRNESVPPEDHPPEHHRHILKRVIWGTLLFVGIVIVLNIIFYVVGFRSGFFHRWAEGQEAGMVMEVRGDGFTIVGRNGVEKTIIVDANTVIKREREFIGANALQVGMQVIILGVSQSDTVIEAHTIRIFQDDAFRGSTHSPPF